MRQKFYYLAAIGSASILSMLSLHAQQQFDRYSYGNQRQLQQPREQSDSSRTQDVQRQNKISKWLRMDVQSFRGDTIGEVKDVVIDVDSKQISYVVVDAEEILDKNNNTLVAVPFSALTPTRDGKDLMLQAGQQRIERAETFGKNNWPRIRQAGWGNQWVQTPKNPIYSRGSDGKLRTLSSPSMGYSDNSVKKVNKASELVGMTIKNDDGDELGEIKDLVVNTRSGQITYVVLDAEGLLEGDRKNIAIDLSAFEVDQERESLKLNADKSQVAGASSFGKDEWPAIAAARGQMRVGAGMASYQGGSEAIEGSQDSLLFQGVVSKSKSVDWEDDDTSNNTVAQLELRDGWAMVVDLGSDFPKDLYEVDNNDLEGRRISIRGEMSEIDGKPVLKARDVSIDGDRLTVR